MNKKTIVSDSFWKDFLTLTKKEQSQTTKAIKLMATNIKHPSLRCHAVKSTPYQEVYVNKDIRLIFETTTDMYVLHRVGHHDILDKL